MTIRTIQVRAVPNGGNDYTLTIDSMYAWMTNNDTMRWEGVGLVDSFTVKFDKGDPCPFNWPNDEMLSTAGNPPRVEGSIANAYQGNNPFKYSLAVTVRAHGNFQGGKIDLDPEVVVDDNGPPPGDA